MTLRRYFLDTAVLAFAAGAEHPQRQPCRALVGRAAAGEVDLHVSVEAVQEFLFHRLRRTDRASAVAEARDVVQLCVLHPFDRSVVHRMIELVATSSLGGRDAVHAATAQVAGFDMIVSPDDDFDAAPDLARLSPERAVRELRPG